MTKRKYEALQDRAILLKNRIEHYKNLSTITEKIQSNINNYEEELHYLRKKILQYEIDTIDD